MTEAERAAWVDRALQAEHEAAALRAELNAAYATIREQRGAKKTLEEALGTIGQLREENARLREQLGAALDEADEREYDASCGRGGWV